MDFVDALNALIDPVKWLVYGPPAVAVLALSAFLAGYLKLKKGIKTNYTRKVFHVFNFTYAAVIYGISLDTTAILVYGVFGIGAMVICIVIPEGHILLEGLAREQDEPYRKLYIIVPFIATAIAGVVDNWLFTQFAVVGYLVSGWGDAAGEPVGVRWGKHKYKVPSLLGVKCTRSYEGSAGVFVASWIGSVIALNIASVPVLPGIGIGLIVAAGGTFVEAISSHGLDNLTVQIAATMIAFACAHAFGFS
jgi:phytol kinase